VSSVGQALKKWWRMTRESLDMKKNPSLVKMTKIKDRTKRGKSNEQQPPPPLDSPPISHHKRPDPD